MIDGGDDERTAVVVAAFSPTTPHSLPSLFHALLTSLSVPVPTTTCLSFRCVCCGFFSFFSIAHSSVL
jgi:hypothetical protein